MLTELRRWVQQPQKGSLQQNRLNNILGIGIYRHNLLSKQMNVNVLPRLISIPLRQVHQTSFTELPNYDQSLVNKHRGCRALRPASALMCPIISISAHRIEPPLFVK